MSPSQKLITAALCAIFVILTACMGCLSLIVGGNFHVLQMMTWLATFGKWKLRLHHNPARYFPTLWMWLVWHCCFRPFGQTMQVHPQYPPESCQSPGIKILLVSPHPSTLETILALYAALKLSPWVVVSLKGWYFWIPFLGQGLWATGCGVFIIRLHDLAWVKRRPWLHTWLRDISMRRVRNKMQDLRHCAMATGKPILFLIFPDSRWREDRAQAQLDRFESVVPGMRTWIPHMLLARSGAFLEALAQAGDLAEVIDLVMVGHKRLEDGWTNFSSLFGTRWQLAFRVVTSELVHLNDGERDLRTLSKSKVEDWLNRWRAPRIVHELIAPWRQTG